MTPVALTTRRLVLDQPVPADREVVTAYCQDPIFEVFLTTPWPYELRHADSFIDELVPRGWADDTEYTWALRRDGLLIGMIGYRRAGGDIGFWLGRDHRGRGYMPEAVAAVTDWLFSIGVTSVAWECVVGNTASASVARRTGFTFGGVGPSRMPDRASGRPDAWHGLLRSTDDRIPQPGWPRGH